ncbi:hypothetical protein GGS21DRAFT_523260 [Xylaria nigripes]|nr:hypothetical protein GGS21DRAFT_523260 [Xylaria nigripes]
MPSYGPASLLAHVYGAVILILISKSAEPSSSSPTSFLLLTSYLTLFFLLPENSYT